MMETMMNHDNLGRLLAQYFEGVLAEEEKDRFEAHYPDCALCSEAIHRAVEGREMVDRYALHKLSPGEQEFFEKHYFGCRDCIEAVKEAEYLISGVRYAARENLLSPAALRPSWLERAQELWAHFKPVKLTPAIAFAMLALLLLYPAWRGLMELPRLERAFTALQQPQANTKILALESTRGERQRLVIPQPSAQLSMIILQPESLGKTNADSRFRAAIIAESSGKKIWEDEDVGSGGEDAIFTIACPSSFFKPGVFALQIEEVDASDSAILQKVTFQFEVALAP